MNSARMQVGTMLLVLAGLIAVQTGIPSGMVFGAPAALDCRYVMFTSPASGAVLSGPAEVRGRALILDFQFYKVEYSPVGQDAWVLIGTDVIRTPVENGRLVVWQTNTVQDGTYGLRLRVVDPTGNYCESILSPVRVLNARPTQAPIALPTETEILTVVPPQSTPTLAVALPTEIAPRLNTPGALPTRSLPIDLPAPNVIAVGVFFLLGLCGMLGIAFIVALVMVVRHLRS